MGNFLEFDDETQPTRVPVSLAPASEPVAPVPAPLAPTVIPPERKGMLRFFKDFQPLIITLIVAGSLIFYKVYDPTRPGPAPDITFSMKKEAKGYARDIVNGYGDSCVDAAGMIRAGTSFSDAQEALKSKWKDRGQAAFVQHFGTHLNQIAPEGTEPTAAQREAMAQFLEELGKGVKQ